MITGISAGLYTVTVSDATGCPSIASVYLPVQVGIDDLIAEEIMVSPNPFTDAALITFPFEGDYKITLSDLSGRELRSEHESGKTFRLEKGNLPAGIYILSLQKDGGVPALKKIVVG